MAKIALEDYDVVTSPRQFKITPIVDDPQTSTITFGLGNATVTLNITKTLPASLVVPVNSEAETMVLLPPNVYDAPKWAQIGENVTQKKANIASAYLQARGKPPIVIKFKGGNFRKFKFVGGALVTAGWAAISSTNNQYRINW